MPFQPASWRHALDSGDLYWLVSKLGTWSRIYVGFWRKQDFKGRTPGPNLTETPEGDGRRP